MPSRVAWVLLAGALALPAQGQVPGKSYAQELIDRTVAANPGLLVAVMHATPPKAKDNVVVASNIGRLGRIGGEGERRVIESGKPRVEATRPGTLTVEVAMHDAVGDVVGALELAWPHAPGEDPAAFVKRAEAIRDGLAKRILNAANLMDPFPFEPGATTRTHAQKLVDEAQARDPGIIVLAMRAPSNGTRDIVVLGTTFGRHGKKADADDLKVLTAVAPAWGVYSNGKRFGVDLPLRDRSGQAIGTMNVGFRYRPGEDRDALVERAERLRDELQRKIGSADELDVLDP